MNEYNSEGSANKNKKNERSKILIVIIALVLVIFIMLGLCLYFYNKSKNEKADSTTEAVHTAAAEYNDAYMYPLYAGNLYVSANTPSGAGLVMHKGPGADTEEIGILKENEVVFCLDSYKPENNGYVFLNKNGTSFYSEAKYFVPFDRENIKKDNAHKEANDVPQKEPLPPPVTNYPSFPGNNDAAVKYSLYEGMTAKVKNNTPSNAGINIRNQPDFNSGLVATIKEGAYVDIIKSYSAGDGGYIYIGAYVPEKDDYCEGWVLAKYLNYSGYRDIPPVHEDEPAPAMRRCRVKNNTPGGFGINLRQSPSSTSYLIDTIPEGEILVIAQPYSPSNKGYIKVYAENYYSDTYSLEGWVLEKYVEYIN